jgi:inorganic pyrophosphatase
MIQVLIQVAAGTCDRRIYNERTLEYMETRPGSEPYIYPYGFVVGTSAADGACVDCYLITSEKVRAGSIVECEPVGLLLQDEDGEIDHKVLAALPGQVVVAGPELEQELRAFIYSLFGVAAMKVRVGPLLPREAALEYLQKSQPE